MKNGKICIIGAGLAGSEAAWQAANADVHVDLYEMRPSQKTPAHKTGNCAELVCSNSLRSDDYTRSAVGLLHEEMRRMNSLIMRCADENRIAAGGALAVDREAFSQSVTNALREHNNITMITKEITQIPPAEEYRQVIVATGPLTSDSLAQNILELTGEKNLSFFDALAPIVMTESIDMSKAWFQSRYDKGDGKDYLNCPLDEEQYNRFIDEILKAEKIEFKDWEKNTPYFEGCLPIEVMAERGRETLRFGPMKPVGLTNPHAPETKPYAVVQLRFDNKLGTLMNMVGFQTKMRYGEQLRVFRMIPGLENAEFVRLGGIHRNSFINSPILLDNTGRLKSSPHIRFAGQITGVEGYVESAASGLMAGRFAAADITENGTNGSEDIIPARTTALGSLLAHITGEAEHKTFQPMNINFGLFPPLENRVSKKERPIIYCKRALQDLELTLGK